MSPKGRKQKVNLKKQEEYLEYKEILASLLDNIERQKGRDYMVQVFASKKQLGINAMNREVLVQILADCSLSEREEFMKKHPELRSYYDNRLK